MKNVLSNKKVVQMLMIALQKKNWKKNHSIIKSVFQLLIQCKEAHSYVFARNKSFLGFYCPKMFVLVWNLGLFEITEWEPCMWQLNTYILGGNAARPWHWW